MPESVMRTRAQVHIQVDVDFVPPQFVPDQKIHFNYTDYRRLSCKESKNIFCRIGTKTV